MITTKDFLQKENIEFICEKMKENPHQLIHHLPKQLLNIVTPFVPVYESVIMTELFHTVSSLSRASMCTYINLISR
jgi:uncharacterized protein YlaN (UPF0358 family)